MSIVNVPVSKSAGVIHRYTKGFFNQISDSLDNFLVRSRHVLGEKAMPESLWRAFFQMADQDNATIFVHMGEDGLIGGAMQLSTRHGFLEQYGLKVGHLQGLGNGAGTDLLKSAVQESIERGYGGKFFLEPIRGRPDLIEFYTNRGGQYIDGMFFWDEAAAQILLNQ